MAFPTLTETFNTLYAAAFQRMGKTVTDTQYSKMPLLYWLDKNRRVSEAGGRWIGRPIQIRKNTAAASFGRGATFSQVDLDAITVAKYDVKNVGIPLTRYWEDEQIVRGESEIFSQVEANVSNSYDALREAVQTQLWAVTPGSKDLWSLLYYLADAPTTGTVAGINRANESDWRNQYKDSDADGSANTYLLQQMRELVDTYVNRWGNVDYIMCGTTAYSIYDDVALGQKEIQDKRMGDAEFANLGWRGIPLVLDHFCPVDAMYFISSKTFEWAVHPNWHFTWNGWKDIPDQMDRTQQCVIRGQLLCTNPKANGVLFDIAR